jgi:hypothetical protein
MKKLPKPHADTDAMLKGVMAEIEALIEAIAAEEQGCDLKLAALLEGKPEAQRKAIIEKIREMLKARATEKEKELDKHLAAQQRIEVERKRGMFMQWLQWMMSEETLEKMRQAFLAVPMLERAVRHVGRDMANKGMHNIQMGDKRELGSLTQNVPDARAKGRERGDDKGRSS